MVVGRREVGKTFYYKKHCLNSWLKKGKEFIYLRRTQTELDEIDKERFFPTLIFEQVFDDFELVNIKSTKGGTSVSFYCSNKEHGLDIKENKMNINSRKITINDEVVCYMKSLSTWIKLKGSEYDNTYTILFDEVLIDVGSVNKNYLPNEIEGFTQLVSSVFRSRKNCRCILLCNAGNFNNPYFNHFNFNGDDSKRFWKISGRLPNGKKHVFAVIEFAPNIKITAETNPDMFLLTKGTKVFESNINNEFQNKSTSNIGKLTGYKLRLYTIHSNGFCMTAYNVDGVLYIASGFDVNLKCHTFSIHEIDRGFIYLTRSDSISKAIRWHFYRNLIYYENQEVKTKFTNAIKPIL